MLTATLERRQAGAEARRIWPGRTASALAVIIAAIAAVFFGSGAAQASTGWFQPDPNATTSDTPAAAYFHNSQVVAIRGTDNALWYDVDNGPMHRIGGSTLTAPALTEFGGNLLLFQTGRDGGLWYQGLTNVDASHSTWSWSGATPIPGPPGTGIRTSLRPAIASSGDQLHIIVVGNNEHIYHSALRLDGSWSGWQEIPGGGRTEHGPAASTSPDGYLMVIHAGTNNVQYVQRGRISTGAWEGSWSPMPYGRTTSAPALTYNPHDGRMVEAWRDADGDVIMTSESSTRGVDQINVRNIEGDVVSPSGPGLAAQGNAGLTVFIQGGNFYDVQGDLFQYGGVYGDRGNYR